MRQSEFTLEAPRETENDVKKAILEYLKYDSRVAWAHRFNVGASMYESMDRNGDFKKHFVRFAFPGCSDILGQMKDGRFLAIEVKSSDGKVSREQQTFLEVVNKYDGIGIVARSVADVVEGLGR